MGMGKDTKPATWAAPAPGAAPGGANPELDAEALRLAAKAREIEANAPEVIIAREQQAVVEAAVKKTSELLYDLTDPLVNKLWLTRCPVPEDQYKTLMESYAAVIEKRWPGAAEQWGPEVAALALTVAMIGPRVIAIRRAEAQEAAAKKADGPGDQGAVPNA